MKINTYKANVMRTLSVKPAKEALRYTARNTARTNIMHAATGVATEALELVTGLTRYILEGRMTPEMKDNALEEMGDLGYYLTVLAKATRAKVPASSKKVKLEGTAGAQIFQLLAKCEAISSLNKKTFYGVKVKEHENPKTLKTRMVLDAEAQKVMDAEREQQFKHLVEETFTLFYGVCWTLFKAPAEAVMAGNIAKLSHRYPQGFFQQDAALGKKDTAGEVAQAKQAASASKQAVVK